MALKEYISLARLTEVFGYLKTKLDGKVNKTDIVSKQAAGLVPQLPDETTTTKYLRQDGSWEVPPGGVSYTEGDGVDISQQNEISIDTTFTEASTRANIDSGDTFSTILGKIKKWFSDLPDMFVSKQNGGTFGGDITVDRKNGTASAEGFSYFKIGNATPVGTNQNSTGLIELYSESEYPARLYANPLTQQRYIGLPDKNGTVALTSDIPDISTKVSKSGDTMTGRLTANGHITAKTSGGSFISQKDTANAAIQITPDAVLDGTRFDSIISGKNTDGSTWCIGIINNTLYIGYFAANHTANNFTKAFTLPLSSKGGTVAVTSEIPTDNNQLANGAGYITSSGSCASATNASNAARLYANSNSVSGYVSGDTHILRLGYFKQDAGYNNVTLLVTSGFWGNQHGSADIININQDSSSSSGAYRDLWRIRISDKVTRTFYYKVANDVVYLYVYVTGGNGYGKWNVSVIQASDNKAQWVNEVVSNQSSSGLTEIPYSGQVGYASSAENVRGTVAVANGGTGATTKPAAVASLFGADNISTSANYFLTITSSFARVGYTSVAEARTVLGLKSAAYLAAATATTASTVAQRDGSGHLNMVNCNCAAVIKTTDDWLPICGYGAVTIRNRNNSAYIPAFASAFTVNSSRRYKENIVSMTEEDAKTLLSLRPVIFDYKEGIVDGDRTGQKGLIAEEVAEIETFPVVYNQDGEVEGLDYSKFVPQLIKLCQMQQKQIDDLTARLEELERNNQ